MREDGTTGNMDAESTSHYDGALLCTTCADRRPREDTDWCPAIGRVVCDDCCRSLMLGEHRILKSGAEDAMTLDQIVVACVACPRLAGIVEDEAFGDEPDVRFPLH